MLLLAFGSVCGDLAAAPADPLHEPREQGSLGGDHAPTMPPGFCRGAEGRPARTPLTSPACLAPVLPTQATCGAGPLAKPSPGLPPAAPLAVLQAPLLL